MANYPDIRIGNDIPMEWSFYYPSEEGSEERRPFNLEGRDLTVTMSRLGQGRPIEDFLVEGNKIIFTFYGKDQAGFGTGVYTLTLCENLGENNMHTLDKMEVFRLVSRQETVISGEPYTSSMVSTLEVAPLMFESVVGADYLSHDDIADDLDTDDPNYVLSARMGVVLREAIEDESDNAIHKSGNETIVSGVKTFGPDSTLAISGGDLVLTDKDANLSTILDDESDARANADEALAGRLSGVETEMQKVVNITVGGTDTYFRGAVYAPSVNVTGTIRANSLIESRGNISASGGVTAGGALRGSSVVSSGPISENGMPLSQRYMAIGNAYTKSQTDTLLGEKADAEEVDSALAAKQDTLESGVNIKTINGESLLGSGDLEIGGGGGTTEIFIAEYDVTPFADIYAAYQAGKYVVAKTEDGRFLTPFGITIASAMFYEIEDDGYCYLYEATPPDGWESVAEYHIPDDTLMSAWNAKYDKPSGGIPKTDLASAVRTSLGKADTALQSFTETDPIFLASAAHGITSSDITNWNGKYTKPASGIPASDLASGVIPTIESLTTAEIDTIWNNAS